MGLIRTTYNPELKPKLNLCKQEKILISVEEYRELLTIKGRYLELKEKIKLWRK